MGSRIRCKELLPSYLCGIGTANVASSATATTAERMIANFFMGLPLLVTA